MSLMNIMPRNPRKDMEADLEVLREKEGNILPFLKAYKSELKKPEYIEKPKKYGKPIHWKAMILSYATIIFIFLLDVVLLGEAAATKGNFVRYLLAGALLFFEIVILYQLYIYSNDRRIKKISFKFHLIKILPILIAGLSLAHDTYTNMIDMEGEVDMNFFKLLLENTNGLIFFGVFIVGYSGLIFLGEKGILFHGLLMPSFIFQEQKARRDNKINSRSDERIDKLELEIRASEREFRQAYDDYNFRYNPIYNGLPNENYLAEYEEEAREGFVFQNHTHSLSNDDIRVINQIYQTTRIALEEGNLNEIVEDNNPPVISSDENNNRGGLPEPNNETEPPNNEDRPLTGGGNQLVTD